MTNMTDTDMLVVGIGGGSMALIAIIMAIRIWWTGHQQQNGKS